MAKITNQSNGDTTGKYNDMKLGVVLRSKLNPTYLEKIKAEYAKLSPKQKQSFRRTNSVSSS